MKSHIQVCGFADINCLHKHRGCLVKIQKSLLSHHLEKDCLYSLIQCGYCDESLSKNELQQHLRHCSQTPISCPNECGVKNILRLKLDAHLSDCPNQKSDCIFSDYICRYTGLVKDVRKHMESFSSDHLQMMLISHEDLQLKHAELDRKYTELDNEKSIIDNKFKKQSELFTKDQDKKQKSDERIRYLQKTLASQNDKIMKLENVLTNKAALSNVKKNIEDIQAVKESCIDLEERLKHIEKKPVKSRNVSETDIDYVTKQISQIATQLGMNDVRLSEQDLRFDFIEKASYGGTLIWKIKNYARRKQESVNGKPLSLYSKPFYTSTYGYKLCARVYINGDGMGKGTHMSLFFVVMRGDYDDLLQWPFIQKVTLLMLDQETHARNISDTFRPDPTSSSFKKPTCNMNIASGCPLFVSQSVLETPKYIKNDTLYIKVIVDTHDIYF